MEQQLKPPPSLSTIAAASYEFFLRKRNLLIQPFLFYFSLRLLLGVITLYMMRSPGAQIFLLDSLVTAPLILGTYSILMNTAGGKTPKPSDLFICYRSDYYFKIVGLSLISGLIYFACLFPAISAINGIFQKAPEIFGSFNAGEFQSMTPEEQSEFINAVIAAVKQEFARPGVLVPVIASSILTFAANMALLFPVLFLGRRKTGPLKSIAAGASLVFSDPVFFFFFNLLRIAAVAAAAVIAAILSSFVVLSVVGAVLLAFIYLLALISVTILFRYYEFGEDPSKHLKAPIKKDESSDLGGQDKE